MGIAVCVFLKLCNKSTGSEKFSTGAEYQNQGNKIC
jgi:hypothetical protein